MKIFSRTDKGKIRKRNEDYLQYDENIGVVVLADGMGGLNAGEVASQQAVEHIMAYLKNALSLSDPERKPDECELILLRAFAAANAAVFEKSNSHYDYYGMGTTLAAAVQAGDTWAIAHVGDSRIYQYAGLAGKPNLTRVTRDHSLVQQLMDEGVLSEEEARRSPRRNIITRAIGIGAEVKGETGSIRVSLGDLLLLCSDGLSDMLDDECIAGCIAQDYANPELLCHNLVDAANAAGGSDNISVVVIQI